MKQKIRLGAGSGFWGDGIDPALELLDRGELDYLCFDFLAELTMALLQRQKLKNPQLGYVPDAVQYMKEMMPLARQRGTRLGSTPARRRSASPMTPARSGWLARASRWSRETTCWTRSTRSSRLESR